MKKMKKLVTSIVMCFGLMLIQFSNIGAAGRETVTIDKSQSTAASPTMPRPASRLAWYTASNGVTSTGVLTATPQIYLNASWVQVGIGGFNRKINPSKGETVNGVTADYLIRLHLKGSKQCIGAGIIRDA